MRLCRGLRVVVNPHTSADASPTTPASQTDPHPHARTPPRTMTPFHQLSRVFTRAFSSTPLAAAGSLKTSSSSRKKLSHMLKNVPTYPFPIQQTFKQSWFGLYGGKHIQFGNNIGPKSQFKTRRFWMPNIRHTHLYSKALGMNLNLEVSTSALREYLHMLGVG